MTDFDYNFIKTDEAMDIALVLMKKAQLINFYDYTDDKMLDEIFLPLYDVRKANQVYNFCKHMEYCQLKLKEAKNLFSDEEIAFDVKRPILGGALYLKQKSDPDYIYEKMLTEQEKFMDEVMFYEVETGEVGDLYILDSLKKEGN